MSGDIQTKLAAGWTIVAVLKFCSALKDGRPEASSATTSPSITVSSGMPASELHGAARLKSNRAIAVQLQFVVLAVRQGLGRLEQHGLNEVGSCQTIIVGELERLWAFRSRPMERRVLQ